MRALTVVPGRKDSLSLEEVDGPDLRQGAVLVDGLAVGARHGSGNHHGRLRLGS